MTGSFERVYEGKANGLIPVESFRSKKTGLTLIIAQVGGPLVNGYFCLATEAFDDDGLPHTLEHLVFMGSQLYPYKGVLDLLANRCLASGTNAWTDTDHTCYTMTTAGSEGFLQLLPIYLDHILYATLTIGQLEACQFALKDTKSMEDFGTVPESAYITEVHHVNGKGEDAGVVYCEMQARENTGESRTHLAQLRALYPGHCGYKSETGGMLENLRTTTSHEKVVNYHKSFYYPENLCLIITGQVKPEDVFKTLEPFEDSILSKGARPSHVRPWQSPVPPLDGSKDEVVKFPSDDEESGMVSVSWRGPQAQDQETLTGVQVLMEYLTDTQVAPLQRDFIEIDDPYCSELYYNIIENSETCFYTGFKNVPMAKLNLIKPKLFEVLTNIADGKEKIDMSRMGSVIHRRTLEAISHLEDEPHDTIAFNVIGYFLYGNTNEEFDQRLNVISIYDILSKKPDDYWLGLMKKYIIGAKCVTISGEPSKSLMEEMGTTEKERVKKQQEKLGEAGLKAKDSALKKATEDNEMEPPQEMLTSVDVPDVGCIQFHPMQVSNNHDQAAANSNAGFPLASIPVKFQLDDIQTNFVSVSVLMDTCELPANLRPYLALFTEIVTESPIMRDGQLISYETVVRELEADTLNNGASVGIGGSKFSCGSYAQLVTLGLKVEKAKYEKGVKWIHELLYKTVFTEERLRIVATKMINDVAQLKRSGRFIVRTLLREVLFTKASNHFSASLLRQHKFLTSLVEKLDKPETAQQVIEDMKKVQEFLTCPQRMRIHVSSHVESLSKVMKPELPWIQQLLPQDVKATNETSVIHSDKEFLYPVLEGPATGLITGVGSVESAFMIQTTPCPVSFQDPDLPAIMVYIQYLTQLEGPMWRQIRGLGLAYHYSMFIKPEMGLLYFLLFKATHVVNAYKQGLEIVDNYLTGKTEFTEVELETCKSSLIFEIIEEEKTPADASRQSMLSYLYGVPHDFNRGIIQAVPKVTLSDLKRVGEKYIAPLFDVNKSKAAICCHPTKVKEICDDFKLLKRELTVVEDFDDSFMAQM